MHTVHLGKEEYIFRRLALTKKLMIPSLAYCHCCYFADRENQPQRHLFQHRAASCGHGFLALISIDKDHYPSQLELPIGADRTNYHKRFG